MSNPLFGTAAASLMRSAARTLSFLAIALVASPSFAAGEELKSSIEAGRANIVAPETLPAARSTNQPLPATPSPVAGHHFGVVKQAGIGGPTAYARGGVLELGGGFAWQQANRFSNISFDPFVGWFFADNFELSFIGKYSYSHNGNGAPGQQDAHLFNLLVEPSVHIPVVDNLFLFAGWGLGVAFNAPNVNAGFSMTPRLGMNILIGRSGILTPSVDLSFISNSAVQVASEGTPTGNLTVNTRYGASISYGVMW